MRGMTNANLAVNLPKNETTEDPANPIYDDVTRDDNDQEQVREKYFNHFKVVV